MVVSDPSEVYICVDVETSGLIPVDYSLLSIGACTIIEPRSTFYIELKPINENSTAEAANVHKLSFERLMHTGVSPVTAMQNFAGWLEQQTPPGKHAIFVAFNAPFDWMFVNYYFIHYIGHNPFGHAALDIKAYYMGRAGVSWSQTSWRFISPNLTEKESLTHHALQDAIDQADLFLKILKET
ncbi:MAG: DNA polymerase III subunit epsilon [Anaerolineales bacterium]|nr:3'-5' exonuclease [Anaerolineae bacterium]PWB50574.1 MAG: DNA polymerase III subunit epsilon [Anaerolineales bacterium]